MNIYKGTYGFIITINTMQNLTTSTDLLLKIKAPSGTLIERALTVSNIVSPKSAGKVVYTAQSTDFVESGKYRLQLFDTTTGRLLASPIINQEVKDVLS